MKFAKAIVSSAIALSALAGAQAMAATFDFSYSTVDTAEPNVSHVVSGSFEGVANGNLVTDISNVSVSVDGTSLGSLLAYHYVGTSQLDTTGATVSFNGLASDFFFSNNSNVNQPSSWFYVMPWVNPGQTIGSQVQLPGNNYIDYYNGQYVPANWSLSEVSAVPEPTNAAMLGAALLLAGLAARKRNQQR